MNINDLYEQLISLDEQAGCFDDETNKLIDEMRKKVLQQIASLKESMV
jgi:hypothetical protein